MNGFKSSFLIQKETFVGELSYILGCAPTASIEAGECGCTVLHIPYSAVISLCRGDPRFLCRLYQSFSFQIWRRILALDDFQCHIKENPHVEDKRVTVEFLETHCSNCSAKVFFPFHPFSFSFFLFLPFFPISFSSLKKVEYLFSCFTCNQFLCSQCSRLSAEMNPCINGRTHFTTLRSESSNSSISNPQKSSITFSDSIDEGSFDELHLKVRYLTTEEMVSNRSIGSSPLAARGQLYSQSRSFGRSLPSSSESHTSSNITTSCSSEKKRKGAEKKVKKRGLKIWTVFTPKANPKVQQFSCAMRNDLYRQTDFSDRPIIENWYELVEELGEFLTDVVPLMEKSVESVWSSQKNLLTPRLSRGKKERSLTLLSRDEMGLVDPKELSEKGAVACLVDIISEMSGLEFQRDRFAFRFRELLLFSSKIVAGFFLNFIYFILFTLFIYLSFFFFSFFFFFFQLLFFFSSLVRSQFPVKII